MDAGAELIAAQHRQLVALAEHAARHSLHFRQRLARASLHPRDLATPDGLRQVPVLRRRDLQSAGSDLYCADVPPSHLPVEDTRTSGSTGEPVVVKRTSIDQLFWSAMTIRDHLWHGRDFSKRLSVIRATVQTYSRVGSWGPPVSLLFATGPSQRIPITASVEQQLSWLLEFKPDNVMIYPATLDALARHCQRGRVALPGLRHIRTIGETFRQRSASWRAPLRRRRSRTCTPRRRWASSRSSARERSVPRDGRGADRGGARRGRRGPAWRAKSAAS